MRKLIALSFLACAVCLAFSCSSQHRDQADNSAADEDYIAIACDSDTMILDPVSSSAFADVTVWDIELVSFTTFAVPCSEEEAHKIEAASTGDDEIWVNYDETTGEWTKHGSEYVPTRHTTVTRADMVKKLNDLMDDPRYNEYRSEVKVKGNKASARWYDGNRGGGISEDFPDDVVDFIMK